ncbi:MAG: hypothetical protein K6F51_15130 [Acetatifactor sp.]|nr:hypothetical protein [Acetatifactor sp.]
MDPITIIILAIALIAIICVFSIMTVKQNKHLKEQQANNTEKRQMLDLMANVMEKEFGNYSYVVGYYTKIQQKIGSTVYYYFPYVLAFNAEELIIFPFIKKEGRLYVRNRLDVNWNLTSFKYKRRAKGVLLTFKMVGETMPICVDPLIKGTGMENTDRPLCIFQEAEYAKLLERLPFFAAKAKQA